MHIHIQPKYETTIKGLLANGPQSESISPENGSYSVYIGDVDYLAQNFDRLSASSFHVLVAEKKTLSAEDLLKLRVKAPFQIIDAQHLEKIQSAVEQIFSQIQKKAKVQEIKVEIQRKRKELEKLNERLNQESEKQILSLEQSHIEETQKNAKEKSLLHFLDFIQSESVDEDFLNLLIKFLWKDLKKLGRLQQIGFGFKSYADKSNVYSYDGLVEHSWTVPLDFKNKPTALAAQMASLWGRPIGKILTWTLPEFSRQGTFFIEVFDQNISLPALEGYARERLVVLGLYLDRWMIEKEFEVLVDRWKRTFNSFSGFVHVIDEDYNIFQSNYTESRPTETKKCYRALAQREEPCAECPLTKTQPTDFMLRPGLRVKTYSSEFKYHRKKYFFVIYEDVTQMHLLKGQMIHSEKMSVLGRLGNHLAHELNNPLTGIKSYVQSLIEEPASALSPTIKSDLNEILKATIRSQNIIKNFIQFSHKSEPKLEKVIFGEVLQNALTLLKSVLRPHRLFVDMKSITVMANAHDLQQVLFNIIKNSCQAMEKAGSLKIYQHEEAAKVYFQIEDTGPGFADEMIENLFEPFMTTKNRGEGTGLGLYLSRKLMQNMHAGIEIKNLVHHGKKTGARISLIFDKI